MRGIPDNSPQDEALVVLGPAKRGNTRLIDNLEI